MLSIPIDGELERRLRAVAARMQRPPQDCALAAIAAWIEDHEEAARNAAQLGGEGVARPPEGYWD